MLVKISGTTKNAEETQSGSEKKVEFFVPFSLTSLSFVVKEAGFKLSDPIFTLT
jgi:hypothetical protein